MYMAYKKEKRQRHYYIRQSVLKDGVYESRELMDLGTDPSNYLVYPGGRSFYIHDQVEEHLDELDITWDYEELEDIFWPFLRPDIRKSLDGFRQREKRNIKRPEFSEEEDWYIRNRLHIVDKRRYNYLRLGELDQSKLTRIPPKFYRPLAFKSRDELEQLFMDMESRLEVREYSRYVYSFFYLRKFFDEIIAGQVPQALNQEKLDRLFLEEICRLNRDETFWKGMQMRSWLHPYLTRYMIMYFDYPFGPDTYLQDMLRDLIARKNRAFQMPPPAKQEVSTGEAGRILGVTPEKLKSMSRRELTRLYRLRAMKTHPDRGGDHEEFIRMSQAYQVLLSKKHRHQ